MVRWGRTESTQMLRNGRVDGVEEGAGKRVAGEWLQRSQGDRWVRRVDGAKHQNSGMKPKKSRKFRPEKYFGNFGWKNILEDFVNSWSCL